MIEKLIATVIAVGSIGSGALFLDDRHAKADEMEKYRKQSEMSHTETRLEFYEDKLMGLQLREKYQNQTPEQDSYVIYEIARVKGQIEKLKRRVYDD